jgi:hypothetical protein
VAAPHGNNRATLKSEQKRVIQHMTFDLQRQFHGACPFRW